MQIKGRTHKKYNSSYTAVKLKLKLETIRDATILFPHDSVQTSILGSRFSFSSIHDLCIKKQEGTRFQKNPFNLPKSK